MLHSPLPDPPFRTPDLGAERSPSLDPGERHELCVLAYDLARLAGVRPTQTELLTALTELYDQFPHPPSEKRTLLALSQRLGGAGELRPMHTPGIPLPESLARVYDKLGGEVERLTGLRLSLPELDRLRLRDDVAWRLFRCGHNPRGLALAVVNLLCRDAGIGHWPDTPRKQRRVRRALHHKFPHASAVRAQGG